PLTAHDVAFSLKILKEKGHPIAQQLLRDFVGAEATDDATVTLRFAPKRARDVPLFTASLPIFSREKIGSDARNSGTSRARCGAKRSVTGASARASAPTKQPRSSCAVVRPGEW